MTASRFDYYVIFGAKVEQGGVPSGSLRRRTEGAFALGGARAETRYLATGAIGEHPPAEADVMAAILLDLGVADRQILREREGTDTLSSVRRCTEIIRANGDARRVFVCSSPYHNLRCRVLFRLLGVRTEPAAMPGDRKALGIAKWLYYYAREVLALPWDILVAVVQGITKPGGRA